MKVLVHNHTIVIYIQYKFHEIPSIAYKVMTDDRKNHLNLGNQFNQRVITPL